MITLPRHANFSNNQARCKGDIQPCIVCGRPCNNPKWTLHIWYGDEVVSESDATALMAAGKAGGDMGMYPVGSSCLHDHPQLKLYAIRQ